MWNLSKIEIVRKVVRKLSQDWMPVSRWEVTLESQGNTATIPNSLVLTVPWEPLRCIWSKWHIDDRCVFVQLVTEWRFVCQSSRERERERERRTFDAQWKSFSRRASLSTYNGQTVTPKMLATAAAAAAASSSSQLIIFANYNKTYTTLVLLLCNCWSLLKLSNYSNKCLSTSRTCLKRFKSVSAKATEKYIIQHWLVIYTNKQKWLQNWLHI